LFQVHNCKALGSTLPLKEMNTEYLLEGTDNRCLELITVPNSCAGCLEILGDSESWSPKGLSKTVMNIVVNILSKGDK